MEDKALGWERLIIEPIQSHLGVLKHHVTGVGRGVPDLLTFLANEQNNPEGKVFVTYRRLEGVDSPQSHVNLHKHTVEQMYCWIGANEDLSGLTVEVFIEDQSWIVESPKSVLIPAGIKHAHRYISGTGHFFGILLTEGQSYNEVTE